MDNDKKKEYEEMAKAETAKAEAEGRIFPKRSKKKKKEAQAAAEAAAAQAAQQKVIKNLDESSQSSTHGQHPPQGEFQLDILQMGDESSRHPVKCGLGEGVSKLLKVKFSLLGNMNMHKQLPLGTFVNFRFSPPAGAHFVTCTISGTRF